MNLEESKKGEKLTSNANHTDRVAIKILKKQKIQDSNSGIEFLLNEIKVHWALE